MRYFKYSACWSPYRTRTAFNRFLMWFVSLLPKYIRSSVIESFTKKNRFFQPNNFRRWISKYQAKSEEYLLLMLNYTEAHLIAAHYRLRKLIWKCMFSNTQYDQFSWLPSYIKGEILKMSSYFREIRSQTFLHLPIV